MSADIHSRSWDPYLTEQDRELLRARPPADRRLGRRPGVVVVDLYRWVFGDAPEPVVVATSRWPGSCGLAAWGALPAISEVLAAARASEVPVIHVLDRDDLAGWGVRGNRQLDAEGLDADVVERRYDIVDAAMPLDGEIVLRKAGPSAFFGTPLEAHLRAIGVDTVVVIGESTSGCVRATVVDARSSRFAVAVPEEAVFDRYEASHAIGLFDMHLKYALVTSASDVSVYLRAS
jgi:maleamate amidohydrolase